MKKIEHPNDKYFRDVDAEIRRARIAELAKLREIALAVLPGLVSSQGTVAGPQWCAQQALRIAVEFEVASREMKAAGETLLAGEHSVEPALWAKELWERYDD